MSKPLEIRPAAREDFLDASEWYLSESVALKDTFVKMARETVSSVRERPRSFPVVFGPSVRRAIVKKFPFSVYFIDDGDRIIILSIFHDSRNPIIWHGRID